MLALKAVAVRLGSTMFAFLIKLFLIVRSRLRSRANLEAENIVLRQQMTVSSRKSRSRVRLRNLDRLFFLLAASSLSAIIDTITVVKPRR